MHITTAKLTKQSKLLITCLATMKQKIKMVDTVIRAGIAYSFYAVPYSLPAIKKLDKKIIALHKTICGLPKCMSNAVTQLPHNMFGTEAFSLKNAYITCIGEQLINALNDKGRLGRIYKGLIQHILAKHRGAQNLTRLSPHDCMRSPITRSLFLLKKTSGTHLKSTLGNFPLTPTPLETQWMIQAINTPTLTPELSLKYLHKLILHNIYEIKHITCPNGTHLMNNEEFKSHYNKPTQLEKTALEYARKLFCKPACLTPYTRQCLTHTTPNTLKDVYKILNHNIPLNPQRHHTYVPPSIMEEYPKPPPYILKDPTHFPIYKIKNDRPCAYTDKYKIKKKYTSYLCQWTLPNDITYDKWLPQKELFPWNNQNAINHNTLLLTQYYTRKQHQHFINILNINFNHEQMRDTRYIPPPQTIPLCHIHINECNPEDDIAST